MRGWLVEWVEKTSFDGLNKLFVISTSERNHETLLTYQNLQAMVRDSQQYVISTLPRFALRVLVPDEHHVLKDLHFYEEARVADAKARQDQLDQKEKKCQEGTLRQAPRVGRSATSSTTHPLSKKKSVPWHAEQTLDLFPPPFSSSSLSVDAGTNWNSIGSPLVGDSPNRELKPVVLYIILELEEEEEDLEAQMAPNLRVGFKQRHCKRLSEALLTTPPLAKKTRLEVSHEEPILDAPMVQVPPSDVVRSEQELIASPSVEDIFPMEDGTPTATPDGDANERDALAYLSIWEEITTLLKMIP